MRYVYRSPAASPPDGELHRVIEDPWADDPKEEWDTSCGSHSSEDTLYNDGLPPELNDAPRCQNCRWPDALMPDECAQSDCAR